MGSRRIVYRTVDVVVMGEGIARTMEVHSGDLARLQYGMAVEDELVSVVPLVLDGQMVKLLFIFQTGAVSR